ncbi:MAG TPA: hypothetical protein VHE78_13580 [Gemmatimonadaceae bacterium]|nr:hypothetical protein [Gemmatimonadaceae bacterium]
MSARLRRVGLIALTHGPGMPAALTGQGAAPARPPAVLFICEHGTIKSLLAKVLFERYASVAGLRMEAVSRGTTADSIVPPWMRTELAGDHFDVTAFRPRPLRPEDLAGAALVVSFDVPASVSAPTHAPRERWDGLPSVSADYAAGRDAIEVRVHHLVDSLMRVQKARQP